MPPLQIHILCSGRQLGLNLDASLTLMAYFHFSRLDLAVPFIAYLISLYFRSLFAWRARLRGRTLPPGPTLLPVVGYADMPKVKPWLAFGDMRMEYGWWSLLLTNVLCIDFVDTIGDVVYFRRLGQHNLILGSPAAIAEYLEKRPANTSDRVLSPSIVL